MAVLGNGVCIEQPCYVRALAPVDGLVSVLRVCWKWDSRAAGRRRRQQQVKQRRTSVESITGFGIPGHSSPKRQTRQGGPSGRLETGDRRLDRKNDDPAPPLIGARLILCPHFALACESDD